MQFGPTQSVLLSRIRCDDSRDYWYNQFQSQSRPTSQATIHLSFRGLVINRAIFGLHHIFPVGLLLTHLLASLLQTSGLHDSRVVRDWPAEDRNHAVVSSRTSRGPPERGRSYEVPRRPGGTTCCVCGHWGGYCSSHDGGNFSTTDRRRPGDSGQYSTLEVLDSLLRPRSFICYQVRALMIIRTLCLSARSYYIQLSDSIQGAY